MTELDHTHDADATSWVESANRPENDFPIQNLPLGRFRSASRPGVRTGVAIGDQVLDLGAAVEAGLLADLPIDAAVSTNDLMALPPAQRRALRHRLFALLVKGGADTVETVRGCLAATDEVDLLVPAEVGDFTDFYASIHHATRVGQLFRPDNPLLPNYRWIPIGYHGRASSLLPSGTAFPRPRGQLRPPSEDERPRYLPSERMDFELEVGVLVAGENAVGEVVDVDAADERIFGLCLVNDWSARDVQGWEYQPLGPFLGKSFATTVSPWVITREALAPFRSATPPRAEGNPDPLPHLDSERNRSEGAFDIQLEVTLSTRVMRREGLPAETIVRGGATELYWTFAQMLSHHASNGCNLRPGDLIASGTVSGPERAAGGCLLELTTGGQSPLTLSNGEKRAFLHDGDQVELRGRCVRTGYRSIGFGACSGELLPVADRP